MKNISSGKPKRNIWVVTPINIKIEDITNMAPPTSRKEVRKFICVMKYYHYIWTMRSHNLAPLTKVTSIKRNFKWTKAEQDAFNKIKRTVSRDTILTYTDFDETFKIHTDASAFQIGGVISQK